MQSSRSIQPRYAWGRKLKGPWSFQFTFHIKEMESAFILDLLRVKVPCGDGNIAEPLERYKISNAFGFPQRWVDAIIRSPSLQLNPAPVCYSRWVLAIFCDRAESQACDSCLIRLL